MVFLGIEYRIANISTLVSVRIFCYITNKLFVFRTKYDGFWNLIKEMISFFLARMITFLMDYYGVILLVEIIGLSSFYSKLITAVIVVISNYVFSKLFVFRRSKRKGQEE